MWALVLFVDGNISRSKDDSHWKDFLFTDPMDATGLWGSPRFGQETGGEGTMTRNFIGIIITQEEVRKGKHI